MGSFITADAAEDCGLRWLHLTDLHVGKPHEGQEAALKSVLESIHETTVGARFDLVMLTGDLAFSGKATEYALLEEIIIKPLRMMDQFREALFVAAPGNHDLDCDVGLPILWSNLGGGRQHNFFNSDATGLAIRKSRAVGFESYTDFVRRNDIFSVDPTVAFADSRVVTIKGRRLAIVSLATAIFSDKEVSDEQKSVAPVQPLRLLFQSFDEALPSIVIGHHPITWFTPESAKHLKALLTEKGALYLNGHEHQITTLFGNRGLLALGFGAIYQNALDATQKKNYRNSYTVCEFRDVLHVKVVSWDYENGKWRVEQNLPADFSDESNCISGGFTLTLPTTRIATVAGRPYASLASTLRPILEIDTCLWLAKDPQKRWTELLSSTGRLKGIKDTFNLRMQKAAAGHHEFRVNEQRGRTLIYVACGSGDVLNYDQLQGINTELDMEDYDNCIVATLGTLSEEAAILANRLKSRKPLLVLEREELMRDIVRHEGQSFRKAVAEQNPAQVTGTLVITDSGVALLRTDRISSAWFDILDGQGAPVEEFDELVSRVRKDLPMLGATRYGAPLSNAPLEQQLLPGTPEVAAFNRQEYLDANYFYFDDVKYAPLAALGFRFRKASLSEIYIDANANINGNVKNTQNVERAVGEFIDSLNLPKAQRDQLESQLRSRLGIDRTAEIGAARQLYQRYNNVVVLGDPGSGKTCFVKHELLAYCKPPAHGGSWYAHHLPIYVSLAEASRLSDETTGLLDICEILSARRGIRLPKEEINKAISAGKVAFFFDGLDEVGFIEKRMTLVSEINDLVKTQAHRGNRFVIASRPAAVQPVEIPEGLTYLNLRGLSEPEMRVLAGRVLTIRIGDDDGKELSPEEHALVERLIDDTKHSPGIARIARNPLLLTLLVLIYANTGAISAKRHVIYTQAIKTLVSVRGRDTREQQISEADLRTRLGAVAVAIFCREIAEIPRRIEVNKILRPIISIEDTADKGDIACNAFLQEVAEATGLLTIHSEGSSQALDLVTFMHYSFLEYYAAAGLLSRDYSQILPPMVSNPRWKDVITLMFGILSEQGDITSAIQALLETTASAKDITKKELFLALECAAECDVPPIATQQMLSKAIYETVASGAGRISGKVREEVASRLAYFLQGASTKFDSIIIDGLNSGDQLQAAAFADMVARLPIEVKVSEAIRTAFLTLLDSSDPVVTVAVLYALERHEELRTSASIPLLLRALKGSIVEKHGALKVIIAVPAHFQECRNLVERLLQDPNDFVSSNAAQCILACSPKIETESPVVEQLLIKLIVGDDDDSVLSGVTLDERQTEQMIASENKIESELALRHLPMIRDQVQFVYQTLSRTLRAVAEPRLKAAAMDSLRVSPGALNLITLADTDVICECIRAEDRNVRIAAIRLMGKMPDDEQVISTLQEYLIRLKTSKGRELEVTETAKALAKHAERTTALKVDILKLIATHLPSPEKGFGDGSDQRHLVGLLSICESLGGEVDNKLATTLLKLAEDYRTPKSIRTHAMRAFGRISEASIENAETIVRLLAKNDPKLNFSVYAAALFFVGNCRRKVEAIRRIYPRLSALRDILCAVWARETSVNAGGIDLSGARDVRDAIICIEELLVQYSEFSERAEIASA